MAQAINKNYDPFYSYLDWAWDIPKGEQTSVPKILPCYEMVIEEDDTKTYLTAVFDEDMPDVFELWWTKMSIKDVLMKNASMEEIAEIQHTGANRPIKDEADADAVKYKEYIPRLVNGLWAVLMYTGTRLPLNVQNMPWLALDTYNYKKEGEQNNA